jgi:hypothetical protein
VLHIPVLRRGRPYRSLDTVTVPHHRTGDPFVEISQANPGLIRRDLLRQPEARDALAAFSSDELVALCEHAADRFTNDTLPLSPDDERGQSPRDYVEQLSATTGLPYVMVRRNMEKVRSVLAEMRHVLNGLTRQLDLRILDTGYGQANGQTLSFYPRTDALGVVLPSNSPGVHTLWAPATALKIPLVLKPGSAEPWTPYRMVQALMAAGAPPEAFGYYPADHVGAAEIVRQCGRSMVFGDTTTTAVWRNDPRVELHGPGYSKIVIGRDEIDNWERHLEVLVTSIVENGGRSCVNASGVWVTAGGQAIAEALAVRLAAIAPRPAEDDQAQLAPFADPAVARRISAMIDADLQQGGAHDVTADYRPGGRLATLDGCTYVLPTVIRCGPDHPLAHREFLFPFAAVVEVDDAVLPEGLGPTLVVSAITADTSLIRRLLASPLVDRLNIGSIPTNHLSWNQPHEGNLFEHLYGRRAFQRSA